MKKFLLTFIAVSTVFLISCRTSDVMVLEGKWKTAEIRADDSERYLPDEMEFFPDKTVAMPGFTDKKMPFKTEPTGEEKKLIRENFPDAEGKNILFIKFDPAQKDWSRSAVFQYTVTGDELYLRPITEPKAVKFKRVPSAGGK
ncbi:MAG TPA: hypothetical protein VEP69_04955 [Thermodesulfovibrionales bacterium]|nr:hypothetical protein [Thermodesulfovibrionales bacterium]